MLQALFSPRDSSTLCLQVWLCRSIRPHCPGYCSAIFFTGNGEECCDQLEDRVVAFHSPHPYPSSINTVPSWAREVGGQADFLQPHLHQKIELSIERQKISSHLLCTIVRSMQLKPCCRKSPVMSKQDRCLYRCQVKPKHVRKLTAMYAAVATPSSTSTEAAAQNSQRPNVGIKESASQIIGNTPMVSAIGFLTAE